MTRRARRPFVHRGVLALVLASLVAAGCVSGAGGSGQASGSAPVPGPSAPSGVAAPTPIALPSASSAPGALGGPGTVAGSGAGAAPNPGGGVAVPVPVPGGPAVSPQPTLVAPATGLTGIHPVGAVRLEPTVSGRRVSVQVDWWSGVEPCSVLAGVDVRRVGRTFTLTVREGSAAAPDEACIDIAQYKATMVDLGQLDPGRYTIVAYGDAAPVTVTVAA